MRPRVVSRFRGFLRAPRSADQRTQRLAFARVLLAASLLFNIVFVVGGGYYLFVLKGHSVTSLFDVVSRIASERWFREEPDNVAVEMLPEIINTIDEFATWSSVRQADSLRHWVYSNCVMEAYFEGTTDQFNTGAVLRQLREASLGDGDPPHLICAPRALALRALYRANGWQVRMAHIFSDDYPETRSHTFLEYFDPELETWVIEDPTFDITYASAHGGRITTSTLVFEETDATPVAWDGTKGWAENGVEHLRDSYLEAMMISSLSGYLDGTIMATPAKFNAHAPFPRTGQTFVQWANQAYGGASVVEVIGMP